ncbi:Uma2 family endonuclease [Streptomyces sp. NPDC046887]|uniref:Uma2 family endonuclease n=1 Tax=Streptomyces sp. NPDC046887 TaxID=3155472 RepID=UPI0033CE8621
MTALAHEVIPVVENEPVLELDELLWRTWKAMELPEGCRAEIIEGAIEVSPTGRRRHGILVNRLRRALEAQLADSAFSAYQDVNVVHRRKLWIPDLFVATDDLDEIPDEEGLGVDAVGVALVMELVSPGQRNIERDRVRKRREYARAGIPVYVIVDDFDQDGAVLVLTAPNPAKGTYEDEHRVPYGNDAVIPSGPAKGFAIGKTVTGA